MTAYYNEFDPVAAQHLRNLIKAGAIAPGYVDERSIEDVSPCDLFGYTQCHFFAGVGVWSLALRLAGWPDTRPIWTASCPCQPFSSAGEGNGFDDPRHLWPALRHLIEVCKPAKIVGEQVASGAAAVWIDLVHADLETMGYAFGCVAFPSAGVGAPHIRDRAYWLANSDDIECRELSDRERAGHQQGFADSSATGGMVNPVRPGSQGAFNVPGAQQPGQFKPRHEPLFSVGMADMFNIGRQNGNSEPSVAPGWAGQGTEITGYSQPGSVANTDSGRSASGPQLRQPGDGEHGRPVGGMADMFSIGRIEGRECNAANQRDGATGNSGTIDREPTAGPTNGHWAAADWLLCRDGKWRPVEPCTFPLAHGAAGRVGRLRAYGNAINAQQAKIFIETVMECV